MSARYQSGRLGSRVATDIGPGTFITTQTLQDTMLEQGRTFIGGEREYGREYDGYYQNRRWANRSKTPTFSPTSPEVVAEIVTGNAVKKVAKKIVANAKDRLEAQAAGLGYNRQFLTPADIQAAPLGGLGAEVQDPATVDVVTAVREIYGITTSLKPVLGIVGDHPVGFIALLLLAIGGGAALGGYIGSGIKTTTK